jgi:3-oxoacyl-[acyl-carrier protein] reductase
MKLGLKGKGVIVTGASRGIGYAIADSFAQEGANVSICARGAESLEHARERLSSHGSTIHAASCDVSDNNALEDYVIKAHKALGDIHVLVNNPSGFGETDDAEGWGKSIDIDLMALVRASWLVVPLIEAVGGGSVIHISSISGMAPSPESIPYGAIKAAVIHLTATQAKMFAEKNIRVNSIAPGSIFFEGGVWDEVRHDDPKLFNDVVNEIPFGRMGTPEEVANVAVFLASAPARWITGQTLAVDGGQLLS